MGCGCGGSKNRRSSVPRRRELRPSAGPKSVPQNGATSAQIRALGLQKNPNEPVNPKRLDEGRRRIEKLRREAIKKRQGK